MLQKQNNCTDGLLYQFIWLLDLQSHIDPHIANSKFLCRDNPFITPIWYLGNLQAPTEQCFLESVFIFPFTTTINGLYEHVDLLHCIETIPVGCIPVWNNGLYVKKNNMALAITIGLQYAGYIPLNAMCSNVQKYKKGEKDNSLLVQQGLYTSVVTTMVV